MGENSSTRQGFTLIELLVVIAIIAILAAILFPIFTAAKEQGRQAQCLSNLRQLGMGFRAYSDDWNGRLPAARVVPETPPGTYLNWCGALAVCGECRPEKGQIFPYVRSVKLYICPKDINQPAVLTLLPLEEQKKYPLS